MKRIACVFLLACLISGKGFSQDIASIETQLDSLTTQVPGLLGKVDFTLVEAPLYELIRAVAETHNLNVSLSNLPQVQITNNFNNVTVKDLIVFLCREYGIRIRFVNNILTFYQEETVEAPVEMVTYDPDRDLLSLNVANRYMGDLARELTAKTPYNVIVNQQVEGQMVTGYIRELPSKDAFENFAEINNLELVKKSNRIYQFQSQFPQQDFNANNNRQYNYRSLPNQNQNYYLNTFRTGQQGFVSLSCTQTPVSDLLTSICEKLGINYILLSEIRGTMDCRLDSVVFEDFLKIALEISGLSYSLLDDGVYIIGDSQKAGLSSSKVYAFKNRSVEDVAEIIPNTISQNVQIKAFNDLNALILTGNDMAISRVVSFLKEIDKAVPNVLIEVIVAEVRKGSSVRTGVSAYLSDSVPTTGGQLFGGVDVTFSSNSLNRFLNNLDSRGIMNLGRVTPQFYATIQAMEESNNLNIRSTPKLSTLNGHEASLKIGRSVYYLIKTQNITGGVNPIVTEIPNYQSVEANLVLKINPFVSELGDVTLTIEAEFSDFIAASVEGAPPGNATREFISKIRVKNEEMVVMGGLEEVSKNQTGSGVPFLSRIPILKWIFSAKTDEASDSKLLIFIKPTIVY